MIAQAATNGFRSAGLALSVLICPEKSKSLESRPFPFAGPVNWYLALSRMHILLFLYCCCLLLSRVQLCNPMDCSTPGFPVLHHFPKFELVMHPTISSSVAPFSSCLQYFPASESFPDESILHIRWPKYWIKDNITNDILLSWTP